MVRIISLVICVFFTVSCAVYKVKPAPDGRNINNICVAVNSTVKVDNFLEMLREGFARRGVGLMEYDMNAVPSSCVYVLEYSAKKSTGKYMTAAQLHLLKNNKSSGVAIYEQRGGAAGAIISSDSAQQKLFSMIDELLGY